MKKLSHWRFTELFCKLTNKWCVYVAFCDCYEWKEIIKAAPYLSIDDDYQIIGDCEGWIVCENEEEAYKIFNQTVGDDGPTELNKYNGNVRIYAHVCGPKGIETENT